MKFLSIFLDDARHLDQQTQQRISRATLYGSLETALSDILALVLLTFSAAFLNALPFPLARDIVQQKTIVMVLLALIALRLLMIVPILIGIGITTAKISRLTRMRT